MLRARAQRVCGSMARSAIVVRGRWWMHGASARWRIRLLPGRLLCAPHVRVPPPTAVASWFVRSGRRPQPRWCAIDKKPVRSAGGRGSPVPSSRMPGRLRVRPSGWCWDSARSPAGGGRRSFVASWKSRSPGPEQRHAPAPGGCPSGRSRSGTWWSVFPARLWRRCGSMSEPMSDSTNAGGPCSSSHTRCRVSSRRSAAAIRIVTTTSRSMPGPPSRRRGSVDASRARNGFVTVVQCRRNFQRMRQG